MSHHPTLLHFLGSFNFTFSITSYKVRVHNNINDLSSPEFTGCYTASPRQSRVTFGDGIAILLLHTSQGSFEILLPPFTN